MGKAYSRPLQSSGLVGTALSTTFRGRRANWIRHPLPWMLEKGEANQTFCGQGFMVTVGWDQPSTKREQLPTKMPVLTSAPGLPIALWSIFSPSADYGSSKPSLTITLNALNYLVWITPVPLSPPRFCWNPNRKVKERNMDTRWNHVPHNKLFSSDKLQQDFLFHFQKV